MDSQTARILLVESDPRIAAALSTSLVEAGYDVTTADGSDGALGAAESRSFDLVLVGLGQNGSRGDELLARRRSDPRLRSVPLVALAPSGTTSDTLARVLELGADGYLQEPFEPRLLKRTVDGWLERARLRAVEDNSLQKLHRLSHDLQDVILPLGISLSTEKDVDRLLERILLEAKSLCRADAGTLYVRTKDERLQFSIMLTDSLSIALGGTTGKPIPFAPLRLMDPATGAPNHRNIATHVALSGQSVNIEDIYNTKAFDFTATREFDRRNNYRSVSTLTVPLKNNVDQVIAVLQLLNALDPATGQVVAFDSYQQLVVESLTSQAAVVFNNQLLRQREQELLKFERDLQIGRQIQKGFLPETLPSAPGWEIAARFSPAREVAGDFYDAFMLAPDHLGFVVADVCDKGVGAALFMALVRSLIRVYTQQRYSVLAADPSAAAFGGEGPRAIGASGLALKEALILTNDYIGQNHLNMNMFATVFAGVVNLENGQVAYVNGGHNAPVILEPGPSLIRLPSTGPAVGMVPGFQFRVDQAHMDPGDLLVAFTDGIPDARDPQGQFFTEPRLLRIVAAMGGMSSEHVASEIQEQLVAHISTAAQFDDITMVVIRRAPVSS
jgi:sigma-B regulation protein RsbU (phosphoserine phosphatase)